MAGSMMDWINACIAAENDNAPLTKKEFAEIRNNGTPEELEEAVKKMEAAGGYECLGD